MAKNKKDKFDPLRLKPEFEVSGKVIKNGGVPFVIAEIGSNFNQDLDTACKLIDAAAGAGADMVKFQLFRAEELYPAGGGMHAIFKSVELNPDWLVPIAAHAMAQGIGFTASAFDRKSVDLLEAIDVPAHKVASSETTNFPLLAYIAEKGRPLFMSTGMCDTVDVDEAVSFCLARGNNQIALMQCGSMYPLPLELANLQVMNVFARTHACPVGFSDHTLGLTASVAAVARGACVIEKHLTLDRGSQGPDHFYALEPGDLAQLVEMVHEAHTAIGDGVKAMLPAERENGRREGLYAARDLNKGEAIDESAIEMRRPAIGLRARYYGILVDGAHAARSIDKGEPVSWVDIEF